MNSNFLRKFVSLFEGTEVPERFATWAGLSCLSAMLERRVWIDMNIFTIYPNMFIIFVADSGRMRKSTAINMTRQLLAKTDPGPKIIAQKITPEALIDALRTTRTDDPKNLLKETCGGIVVADELVSFLNKNSYEHGMGDLMRELWDCPVKYKYRTITRGTEEINYGHLSLLGGTTTHILRDAIPMQAMGDGFSSRVLFIYVDETPKPVPRPIKTSKFRQIEEELILQLQSLSSLQGPIRLATEAEEFFDDEYKRFFHSPFYDEAQFQAYASRRDKHLLKVAMCLMAAEDASMELNSFHLEGAKILIEDIEEHMSTVFDRITMTHIGSMTEEVYRTIEAADGHAMFRSQLLKKFSHKMGSYELSKVTETLLLAKRIRYDTSGGELLYVVES